MATSHADIEQAAFRLFAERGFDGTTLDAIAGEVGVGRRTLFRYYDSKNDIPWGQFALTLEHFRALLDSMPHELPLWEAVQRGVRAFNEHPADADPPHRDRMRLILRTPALQAHSALKYAAWRAEVAGYVARRLDLDPDDLLPLVVGQVALGLALAAYERWLDGPPAALDDLLVEALAGLRTYLD